MSYRTTLDTLPLAAADRLADLAIAEASARGHRICIAVVDIAGQLLAFRRMDGAVPVAIEVAIGKARTSALFRKPLHLFEGMIDAGKASMLSVPGAVPLSGGVPVTIDGDVLGAIGVSGAAGEEDEAMAQAVLAAFAGAAA
ncbi:GlcG/HbpS family heme-binding protein [Novosphingobium sp. 9]|uniref:GlcG/HbpS family heme-binding protein n=1 Tax=Novosphingobium sp. 9 TaxID=2025349 RepID=UPI0021B61CDD|nr:heme-binding protein [Novosphingobium sp. 9]